MDFEIKSRLEEALKDLEDYKIEAISVAPEKEEILEFAVKLKDCGDYITNKAYNLLSNDGKIEDRQSLFMELSVFETSRIESLLAKIDVYKVYESLSEKEQGELMKFQGYFERINKVYNELYFSILSKPSSFGISGKDPQELEDLEREIKSKVPVPITKDSDIVTT